MELGCPHGVLLPFCLSHPRSFQTVQSLFPNFPDHRQVYECSSFDLFPSHLYHLLLFPCLSFPDCLFVYRWHPSPFHCLPSHSFSLLLIPGSFPEGSPVSLFALL